MSYEPSSRSFEAQGYYNVERMLGGLVVKRVPIGACGSCMDAPVMTDEALIDGAHHSSMASDGRGGLTACLYPCIHSPFDLVIEVKTTLVRNHPEEIR